MICAARKRLNRCVYSGPEVRRAWIHHVPMRRYATPEEMTGTVLFLLDPAQSGYLTGEIIAIDGGFRGAGMMLVEE